MKFTVLIKIQYYFCTPMGTVVSQNSFYYTWTHTEFNYCTICRMILIVSMKIWAVYFCKSLRTTLGCAYKIRIMCFCLINNRKWVTVASSMLNIDYLSARGSIRSAFILVQAPLFTQKSNGFKSNTQCCQFYFFIFFNFYLFFYIGHTLIFEIIKQM